jgi:soluble lytic murein transglycosylase
MLLYKRVKSKKGCMGLIQVSRSTGRYMAEKLGIKNYNPFDVKHNVLVGIGYLRELLDQFGDLKTAITVYNRGIVKWLDNPTPSGYSHGVVKRYNYLKKLIKKENGLTCNQ